MTDGQIANIDLVKQVNAAAVYRIIDLQGPISRVKVAEISQLAPASVTKITRQLLEHDLIREEAFQESTGGRRAISLMTVRDRFQFVSCRLGRRTLYLALCDLDGRELVQMRRERDSQLTTEQVLALLIDAIEQLIASHPRKIRKLIGLAVTLPGLVNPESGEVLYMPTLTLNRVPLANLLENHFHLPCYVGNDTRSLALAEHFFGASRENQDAILITVHNGVGSGIISKGRVLLGQNRNVGEIGHIQVERFGRRCHCGNFGCLETIVSNAAIVERTQELIARGLSTSLAATDLTIEQICRAANAGDGLAGQIIQETGEYLGRTIAIMVNLFNPEKILLAGEVVEADKILFPAIRRCVEQQSLPSFHQDLPIVRAHFQGRHTMGGMALIKRALLEGDLLQRIMEM